MHTKGNWKLIEKDGSTLVVSNFGDTQVLIARMSSDTDKKDNASLMTTAPKLLDACKQAVDVLSSLATSPEDIDLEFIKRIIAEAEGALNEN